jgi:hydrogenase maturation factor
MSDPRVIVGPSIGEDAAVIDAGGPRYLVAKTDPITFTADEIGWYAVHINANDIATMGARPLWFLATLLLPEQSTTEALTEQIFLDIVRACQTIGISLVGGHTEITYGITRPIVVGQMLGEVSKDGLVQTRGARPGDVIVLTKGIAIEGTAIIARERHAELTGTLGPETFQKCRRFIYEPGLSVLPEAAIATESAQIHAMHDPTEGGLATALHEVARAAGVGLFIREEAVPVYPETQALCEYYQLNPMGLIASGSLLIVLDRAPAQALLQRLRSAGIAANLIGEVTEKSEGVKLASLSGIRDLPFFERDELTHIPQIGDR